MILARPLEGLQPDRRFEVLARPVVVAERHQDVGAGREDVGGPRVLGVDPGQGGAGEGGPADLCLAPGVHDRGPGLGPLRAAVDLGRRLGDQDAAFRPAHEAVARVVQGHHEEPDAQVVQDASRRGQGAAGVVVAAPAMRDHGLHRIRQGGDFVDPFDAGRPLFAKCFELRLGVVEPTGPEIGQREVDLRPGLPRHLQAA